MYAGFGFRYVMGLVGGGGFGRKVGRAGRMGCLYFE